MYLLILIISLKTKFHHDIKVDPITEHLATEQECQSLGHRLSSDLKQVDQDQEVKIICQKL